MSSSRTRVAYLTSRYPHVSHTFIQREVEGVRSHGIQVATFSVHRTEPQDQLSDADRREAATTVALRDRGIIGTGWDNLVALVSRPVAYVRAGYRAVIGGPPGVKARLWQLFYLAQAATLWRACERNGIKHVHAHFANNAADIARLAAALGSTGGSVWTWSFTMHGPTEFSDVTGFGLVRKAREATFVSCISDYARGQLMGVTPPDRWRDLQVVHCGVDATVFIPALRSGRAGELRLLTVGRLVPEKGLGVLLEAVSGLQRQGLGYELVVVGDGPLRDTWIRSAQSLGISDFVRFLGALGQDDLRSWFDWADVFCLSSFAEGVPVVLMEAMACGLPVVTTRIAGIPELVEDGVGGLLVPAGRPDAVAEALQRLAIDVPLRLRMGEAGRQAVLSRYSLQRETARLASLLRHYAAPGRGTRSSAELLE